MTRKTMGDRREAAVLLVPAARFLAPLRLGLRIQAERPLNGMHHVIGQSLPSTDYYRVLTTGSRPGNRCTVQPSVQQGGVTLLFTSK